MRFSDKSVDDHSMEDRRRVGDIEKFTMWKRMPLVLSGLIPCVLANNPHRG